MESETNSLLERQPSGIKALPSHDDDDEIYDDFDDHTDTKINNSVQQLDNFDENNKKLNYNGSDNGSNSGISSSFSKGENGGLVNGKEFENSVIDPDKETLGNEVGSAQNGVFATGSVMGLESKPGFLVTKGLSEEEEDEEEWGEPLEELETTNVDEGNGGNASLKSDDVRVVDELDGDVVVDSINVDVVEAVRSRVAVVGVDDKKGNGVEHEGDDVVGVDNKKGSEVKHDGDAIVGVDDKESEVEIFGDAIVGVDDKKGSEVEPVGEVVVGVDDKKESEVEHVGDAIVGVDNKKGSEVETLGEVGVGVDDKNGSEVDSVGDVVGVDDKKGSEVKPVGEVVVEVDDKKSEVKPVGDVFEDVRVTSTNEDDSADVDVVGTGSSIPEDKKERKDSDVPVEAEVGKTSEVSEVAGVKYSGEGDAIVDSINVDAVEAARSNIAIVGEVKGSEVGVENSVVEDSKAEKYAPEKPNPIEIDEAKAVGESDSVVDVIEVHVVEAIRSGVAVVGETEFEGTELDTKEVEAPVVENVTSANKFAPLGVLSSSKVEVPGDEVEEAQTNEVEAPESVEISELPNSEKSNEFAQLANPTSSEDVEVPRDKVEEAQTNYAQAPHSVETSELLNSEKSNKCEPRGELQFSGAENEKVQPINVDDEPNSSSVRVEGEKGSNRSYANVLVDGLDIADFNKNHLKQTKVPNPEIQVEIGDGSHVEQEKGDDEGSSTDGEDDLMYFGNGNTSREVVEELETHDNSEMIEGQVVTDSDEEGDSNEEGEGNELFDSAALAALLRAATGGGTDPGTITVRSQDGSRLFSMERPVGLEPSLRSARPTAGPNNSSFFNPTNLAPPLEENLSEEDKKKLKVLQQLKVKFLRLVQRVGFTAEHSLAAQVLYKLNVFAGRSVTPAFSLDNAKQTVMQLEAEGKDNLDFSLNILVLGKTGVGKSAIINSIFGEEKVKINAFEPETTFVNEVCGTVDGVNIRFIDAPGLKSSALEQGFNRKVLASVKKVTKKYPPDVVFYVDRLDSQTRDLNDLPLLKTISNSLGSSIWRNAIITLTHASSAPPDGPSGTPLSYEVFVAQRSHIVQQSIGQAVGEMRLMNLNMMNPVSLVENHPACRKNRDGHKILPNGQAWRPQLLLLCFSVKILSEASATSKPQDAFDSRKLFGFRTRSPPLPYLLSSLLQPRAHPKLSADQGGDSVDSDIDLDDVSDSDQEEEDEYDQLPPFKPLKKTQMAKLSSDQKKAYFEEYDYRVKLLQRKQWREELRRMRETKKNGKNGIDFNGEMPEEYDGENETPAAVPVPLPDMTLPPSFDSDNPAYRYRFLEPSSQFLARPVLDPHGWDHDCGYEGVNVEHNMGIADRFPASFTVQVNKDKKDFNIHLDSAVSAKHGENGSSLLGFDVQTIGKQYAYIVRGESKFKNLKKNKTAAGVTVTFLGENVATGIKVEDQIILGKRLVLVGSTGTVRSQKDAAYGANMEVRLREADYPIGQEQSSFTLSLMKWRGDLAVGANLQSQISVGRSSKMAVRAALNNKMSGQITVRTSSSDHLSLALAGLLPIAVAIYQKLRPGDVSENYTIY